MAAIEIKPSHIVVAGGALLLLVLYRMRPLIDRVMGVLYKFIPSVEGFRSVAYWDVSRYSWGYGTQAPSATATITRDQAFNEMSAYLLNDYQLLKDRVTRNLTANQWAALLSFSYNVGVGRAYNLLDNINTYNDSVLKTQWRKYVYAGGVVDDNLVERREKELTLWET